MYTIYYYVYLHPNGERNKQTQIGRVLLCLVLFYNDWKRNALNQQQKTVTENQSTIDKAERKKLGKGANVQSESWEIEKNIIYAKQKKVKEE